MGFIAKFEEPFTYEEALGSGQSEKWKEAVYNELEEWDMIETNLSLNKRVIEIEK